MSHQVQSPRESVSHEQLWIPRGISEFERWLIDVDLEVKFVLLTSLSPIDLHRLSLTSSILYSQVAHYRSIAWSLSRFLGNWFDTPDDFMRMLEWTGGVISGSQAIRFMSRLKPSPRSDLDIFLRVAGLPEMFRWLVAEGYQAKWTNGRYIDKFVKRIIQLPSLRLIGDTRSKPSMIAVYDFHRNSPVRGKQALPSKVQLVVITSDPIRFIIRDFHSTAVMNIITSREAISVFPVSTFLQKHTVVARSNDADPKPWMRKYERRGYNVLQTLPATVHEELREGVRYVGDRMCWSVAVIRRFQIKCV
ncbi:hypothetical protein DFP72DRAFT_816870 [Ephemerocybe angulata]|uniref:Uncharacterized protein n=1 Tax=Ephemerocybe angulata TaxID=980116 RepID=A0A8H6M1R0_9AGAR|nr:hypothetical protein DFP72DRAFT_816870 [Tulosesus angulatus]